MTLLETISGPRDLDALSPEQLEQLADRDPRIPRRATVSKTGGHLGPEPRRRGADDRDPPGVRLAARPIVFDTGHQSYVHKLLTGRQGLLDAAQDAAASPATPSGPRVRARHRRELARVELAVSWADGISKAFEMTGQHDRHVVAVVGDGALTGGMTWEALNNISDDNTRKLVIIVNDNGRSYAPTIGGMARFLEPVRTADSRTATCTSRADGRSTGSASPRGRSTAACAAALHGFLAAVHRQRGALLEPRHQVHRPGRRARPARDGGGPPAGEGLRRAGDRAHHHREGPRLRSRRGATSPTSSTRSARSIPRPASRSRRHPPRRGPTCSPTSSCGWPSSDERLVGITAAMLRPTGLHRLAERFPDRVFDVGHRRAARRRPRPPASRSAACIRSSRCTRRS